MQLALVATPGAARNGCFVLIAVVARGDGAAVRVLTHDPHLFPPEGGPDHLPEVHVSFRSKSSPAVGRRAVAHVAVVRPHDFPVGGGMSDVNGNAIHDEDDDGPEG